MHITVLKRNVRRAKIQVRFCLTPLR